MSIGSQVSASTDAIKKHWWVFGLIFVGVVVLALWYDHKNQGKLTTKLASLPGIGKLFA